MLEGMLERLGVLFHEIAVVSQEANREVKAAQDAVTALDRKVAELEDLERRIAAKQNVVADLDARKARVESALAALKSQLG